jgi:hypothetical protein
LWQQQLPPLWSRQADWLVAWVRQPPEWQVQVQVQVQVLPLLSLLQMLQAPSCWWVPCCCCCPLRQLAAP